MIDDTGEQLGIMPPPQALAIAKQKGLDLVEISPTANPPVCRIMDFGKYQYQEQKRAREARKHQKVIEVKEIKFRPKVDEHDYQFKKKHIERFLEDGDKVKATIFFRGREMAHPEIGRRILERLIEELVDVAIAESHDRRIVSLAPDDAVIAASRPVAEEQPRAVAGQSRCPVLVQPGEIAINRSACEARTDAQADLLSRREPPAVGRDVVNREIAGTGERRG